MLRVITLLSIICLPFVVQAQKTPAAIRGVVYDTATKRGLAYATVSIVNAKDSTLVSFTRADSTGKFRLSSLNKGKYLMSSSYVGYIPVWRTVDLKEGQDLNLGNMIMTDLLAAGNVTVTARRAPVTINNDTVEFNTENFKTQPNAVVEDLLKKLPGVTVDNDGTVRVNGQRINRVLVNGKEFFTGDPKMATKNLDADAVDKVQVFDKKSDRSEFTGVDDGQSEKAINLKLKKDRNKSLFGKLTAGAGTNERYDAQTNINKFNGDQQLSFIGMGNNTNRQGFSITDILNFTGELSKGMRNGGGVTIRTGGGPDDNGLPVSGSGQNQQGVATTIAGGINYNDTWNKKTDVNASGMGSNIDLRTDRNTIRQNLLPGGNSNYESNSNTARNNKQQRINMSVDSKLDSFTSIKFTPQFTTQQTDTRSVSNYSTLDNKGAKLNDGLTDSKSHSDAFNFGGNALFRKRLKKKGRTISGTVSLAYNDSRQNGAYYSGSTFYPGGIASKDSITNQQNRQEAVTRSLGGNIIYTEPIGKRSLFEFSGYYNSSVGESKRLTYDYSTSGKYDLLNPVQSNDFKSEYTYTGGSINFRSNQKKMNFTVGSSFQEATLYSTNNTNGTVIRQSFTDLLPNAMIQYRINSTRNLNLNYSTSSTQPSTNQLQPVTNVSDPINTYTGNPNLKRSYAQSVSLNYFSANMYTQRNFFAFLSATKTDNAIVNADVIQANGSRVTMPVNANGMYTVFGSVNAGFPMKKIKSRVDVGIGSNIIHNIGFVNGARNEIDNAGIGPNLSYSFSMENKVDITVSGRLNISKAKYSLQPQLNSNYLQQVYVFGMTNYLPWGIVFNNDFNYTVNTGRADGYNTKVPFWNASIARGFLKNKRAEIKLSVSDLLNQNQGVSRNANQNYIEDTRYNVLQRYFLMSFTYSLNKAGNNAQGPRVMIRTIGN